MFGNSVLFLKLFSQSTPLDLFNALSYEANKLTNANEL